MGAKGLENLGLLAESKQRILDLNPNRLSRDRLKYEHYVCDDRELGKLIVAGLRQTLDKAPTQCNDN